MSTSRLINTKFWSDSFVVDKLNPLDRYLFLYFLTNEKTNLAGVYEIPLRTISNETGVEKEEVIRMLKRLKGKVEYKDGWICLINFVKHQNLNNPKIVKGIDNEMIKAPENIAFWVKNLRQDITDISVIDKLPIAIDKEIELNLIKSNLIKDKYSSLFEEFWNTYPEKKGKGKAWDSWRKLSQEETKLCLEKIQEQVKNKHFTNKKGEDFIPHPSTWLNQRRWEDEIKIKKDAWK